MNDERSEYEMNKFKDEHKGGGMNMTEYLIQQIQMAVSSLRANKHDGFHGTKDDQEHFEVVLNSVLRDLDQAVADAKIGKCE